MRIFSGTQPSGDLHIGNYFGALKQFVDFQNQGEALYCIVDLHAITVPQKPEELRARVYEVVATYLASGLDPKKCILFIQSQVPAHTELAWIFNCLVKVPELERMTQFKDKAKKRGESVSVGLFDYPVLMAADILLYDADLVPVGHDQLQHVELASDIAKRFNKNYGETFKIPKPSIQKIGARVMSLDDPSKKMSKSEKNTLRLMDDEGTIRKKIGKAVTDSGNAIEYSKDKPALGNLIEIYHHTTGLAPRDIVEKFKGQGYREFKQDLADRLVEHLVPLATRVRSYLEKPTELDNILREGARKADATASEKIKEVKDKIGLIT
ncbi:MAG: tryptophan--tRNA ligase [bacterium]